MYLFYLSVVAYQNDNLVFLNTIATLPSEKLSMKDLERIKKDIELEGYRDITILGLTRLQGDEEQQELPTRLEGSN